MNRFRIISVLLALALGCILLITGCGSSDKNKVTHDKKGLPVSVNGEKVTGYCKAVVEINRVQPSNGEPPTPAYIAAVQATLAKSPKTYTSYWKSTYDTVIAGSRGQRADPAEVSVTLDQLPAVTKDIKQRCGFDLKVL